MTKVEVKASRHYDVYIGAGLLGEIGARTRALFPNAEIAVIVTDETVNRLYMQQVGNALAAAGFRVASYAAPPGEASKNGAQYFGLLNILARDQLTRSDCIIALGGGVVGDMAGFTAATYQRGVPYIQVPTTLLAMVDSSVGGKTGIDLDAGKNLVGAFYQPSLVLCDTETLRSLPQQVFRDGLAEVVKYGMIGSHALLERLLADLQYEDLEPLIAQCVTMKRDLVQADEFDTGARMLLNFGHTVGHAIEQLSNYRLSHGSAVSIGMAIETRSAVKGGLCSPECLILLERLLAWLGLPDKTSYSAQELYTAARGDKKRSGKEITLAVPRAPGRCELMKYQVEALRAWIEMGLNP